MIAKPLQTALASALLVAMTGAAIAQPACLDARRKLDEAAALRFQVRQEALDRNRDRVCDTLDEVGDRYDDARGSLEDCGQGVAAISLRSELRDVRHMKRFYGCD